MSFASRSTARLAAVVISGLVLACSALEPDEAELKFGPARLIYYGDTSLVELPATVRVGEEAIVQFTSFGGGCIARDTTLATVSALEAVVRPFEREITRLPPRTACTGELRVDRRSVSLRFDQPGLAVVRILGKKEPGDHRVTFERELQVIP